MVAYWHGFWPSAGIDIWRKVTWNPKEIVLEEDRMAKIYWNLGWNLRTCHFFFAKKTVLHAPVKKSIDSRNSPLFSRALPGTVLLSPMSQRVSWVTGYPDLSSTEKAWIMEMVTIQRTGGSPWHPMTMVTTTWGVLEVAQDATFWSAKSSLSLPWWRLPQHRKWPPLFVANQKAINGTNPPLNFSILMGFP